MKLPLAKKIGVIGCGRFGTNHLLVLSRLLKKSQLAAADPDLKRLGEIAPLVDCTFTDYQSMVRELDGLAAVFIVCPTIHHYAVARYCLEAGLDVFVEKPLTLTSRQALALVRLAKERRKLLVPGHLFLYKKAFQQIKKGFDLSYPHSLVTFKRFNNAPGILDEGVIFDLAVHDIYMALNLYGTQPHAIRASGTYKQGALIEAGIRLDFARGTAIINVNWTGLASTREVQVLNGRQEFLWRDTEPSALIIRQAQGQKTGRFKGKPVPLFGPDKNEQTVTSFEKNTLVEEDTWFLKTLTTRHPLVSAREGALTVKIMEKVGQSIKTGKAVR